MSRTRPSRTLRTAGVAAALGASLVLTGCGFDAQTLRTYTPAHGVNVDVNDVKVRNLLVIANGSGQGRLSASIVSPRADTLTGVTGFATNPDGSQAGTLTITGGNGLPLPPNKLVVLTGEGAPRVGVGGSALKPGFNVTLQLTFGSGGVTELRVPVMDAKDPIYRTAAPELPA